MSPQARRGLYASIVTFALFTPFAGQAVQASDQALNFPSLCSIAASESGDELPLMACGAPPSWMMSGSRVNTSLFTNAQGKPVGSPRYASKNGTKYVLVRDTAGHAESYWKLGPAKNGKVNGWSIRKDGTIRGPKRNFSILSLPGVVDA